MLANQSDFMAYAGAFKSNYRKGVHRLETILSNPTMSAEFAANLGGVSVVLGVPISMPDRNSDKLLELLLGSAVADNAVETWLHQFYEFTDWDDLLSDSARCQEMANNPLIWRAAGGSKLAVGKSVATLAGLSCAAYKDIDAVAASQVAMAAVAASQVAMAAVASSQVAMTAVASSQVAMTAIVKSPVAMAAMWRSDTAIKALQANATAWKTFTGASSAVMGKTVAILANLDPSGYADMTAVASSQVAMTAVASSQVAMAAVIGNATALNAVVTSSVAMAAVAASQVAMTAIQKSQTALNAIAASSMATAKYAAGAAGLNPADYADMTAIAASQVAMAAVASSQVAMAAVASSQVAMAAIAASATARAAICASTVAYNYLLSKATYATISGRYSGSGWSTRYDKPCIVLEWCYSYNSGTSGIRTCLDGTASRQYTSSQRYNSSMGSSNFNSNAKVSGTYYKEFVFCSKLETYNSQGDWPAISIAYFPLP